MYTEDEVQGMYSKVGDKVCNKRVYECLGESVYERVCGRVGDDLRGYM